MLPISEQPRFQAWRCSSTARMGTDSTPRSPTGGSHLGASCLPGRETNPIDVTPRGRSSLRWFCTLESDGGRPECTRTAVPTATRIPPFTGRPTVRAHVSVSWRCNWGRVANDACGAGGRNHPDDVRQLEVDRVLDPSGRETWRPSLPNLSYQPDETIEYSSASGRASRWFGGLNPAFVDAAKVGRRTAVRRISRICYDSSSSRVANWFGAEAQFGKEASCVAPCRPPASYPTLPWPDRFTGSARCVSAGERLV